MKKYLAILAYYLGVITISTLVGTTLATHTPWWALIPIAMLVVCGITYIDYRRFLGDNE